jgi:hypothetical protein
MTGRCHRVLPIVDDSDESGRIVGIAMPGDADNDSLI